MKATPVAQRCISFTGMRRYAESMSAFNKAGTAPTRSTKKEDASASESIVSCVIYSCITVKPFVLSSFPRSDGLHEKLSTARSLIEPSGFVWLAAKRGWNKHVSSLPSQTAGADILPSLASASVSLNSHSEFLILTEHLHQLLVMLHAFVFQSLGRPSLLARYWYTYSARLDQPKHACPWLNVETGKKMASSRFDAYRPPPSRKRLAQFTSA